MGSKYIQANMYSELVHPISVIKMTRERSHKIKRFHPTQKPVALMEYLINAYTNKGDIVLDFCAGSGTTGVACVNTKRNFILIEKEAKYVEIARQRIKNPDYKPPKTKTNQQQGFFSDDEIQEWCEIE